jgi:hypothetical protein
LPTYTIKAPDGRTYSIQGPAGATDAQVRAKVLEQYPEAGRAKSDAASFTETFWKQAGRTLPGMLPGPFGAAGKIAAAMFPREATGIVQRGVNTLTGGAADEVVSAVPAVAAAARGQSPRQAFTDAQRAQQRQRERFAQTNPRLATGADIGGGVMGMAIPGMGALKVLQAPKTLGGAIATGAGLGAAGGGFTGLASADEGDRMAGLIGGATTGAAIGGAIPALTPAVQAAIQRFGGRNPMQIAAPGMSPAGAPEPPLGVTEGGLPPMPQVNVSARAGGFTMPTPRSPEDIANLHLARLMQRSGVTPDMLREASPELTSAEAIGQSAMRQLGALARREGQTEKGLKSLISERRMDRPTVMSGGFAEATGIYPNNAAQTIADVVETGRQEAAPLYAEAFSSPITMTPKMADLLNRPAFRNARRSAYDLMENDGLDPNQLGFVVSPDSGDIPIMLPTKSPNLRVLDYIKRGLDVELSQFKDGIGRIDTSNPKAGQLVDLISQFRNELTSASPKYREALARSGDYLSTSAAFNSASRLLSNGTNERDFAVRLNKMSPGERNGLVAGISDWAFNQAQTGKLTPDSIVGVRGQRLRDKLELALGKDNASRIIDTALGEARKMEFENRYGFVNSPSADLIAAGQELEAGLGGPAPTLGQMAMSPIETTRRLTAQGIDYGISKFWPDQFAARDVLGERLLMPGPNLADYLEANPITVPPPMFPGVRSPNPFRPAPPIAPAPRPRR